MMLQEYRKRPVTVQAVRFTDENKEQVLGWITCTRSPDVEAGEPVLKIQTLEGVMTARLGDWIIRGVNGEFYPCRDDIFRKTYEPVKAGVRAIALQVDEDDYNTIQREVARYQAQSRKLYPDEPTRLPDGESCLIGGIIGEALRNLNDYRDLYDSEHPPGGTNG